MDVTLGDLLNIEPRLAWSTAPYANRQPLIGPDELGVTWAVSARTTPPHLPVLRGGEVILIPERVAEILGSDLATLVREARLREISAVVLPSLTIGVDEGLTRQDVGWTPILVWREALTPEAETAINRGLTEHRGELYRVGSELERRMAELVANGSGLEAFIAATSDATGLQMAVRTAEGRLIAAPLAAQTDVLAGISSASTIERTLRSGASLSIGPLRTRQRPNARFLADRIVAGADAALLRDEAARPRGGHRIDATADLLKGAASSASDQRAAALALGLDPDAVFFVAVSHGGDEPAVARLLSGLGTVHPAGGVNGRRTTLIAANVQMATNSLSSRVADIKRRWEADSSRGEATLALSAAAHGVASLPGAAREANFVAALQAQAAFPRSAVSFESVEDIGALRLLYHLRESNELRAFVSEALGPLQEQDRRGTLRATLRAFLESGGSQVDASQRLGIHRNTLSYRLRRIGELVGRDVADPGSWLTLHLALRASEMLDACADGSQG